MSKTLFLSDNEFEEVRSLVRDAIESAQDAFASNGDCGAADKEYFAVLYGALNAFEKAENRRA